MNKVENLIYNKKYSQALLELKSYSKEDDDIRLLYAISYFYKQNYKSALRYFNLLYKINKTSKQYSIYLMVYMAYCLFKLCDYDQALFMLRSHLDQSHDNLQEAYYLMAILDFYKNYIQKCQKSLNFVYPNLLNQDDKDIEMGLPITLKYSILGSLYYKKYKYQKAYDCFKKATKKLKKLNKNSEETGNLDSVHPLIKMLDLLYNMAKCQFELKAFNSGQQLAEHILKQCFDMHSDWALDDSNLNASTNLRHQRSSASLDYNEISNIPLVQACNLLACIHALQGKEEEALSTLFRVPHIKEPLSIDAYTLHNESLLQFSLANRGTTPTMACNPLLGFTLTPLEPQYLNENNDVNRCIDNLMKLLSPVLPVRQGVEKEDVDYEGEDRDNAKDFVGQPLPTTTFYNLLVMLSTLEKYDTLASLLADRVDLTYEQLDPVFYDYLDSLLTYQTSPAEGRPKMHELAVKLHDTIMQDINQMEKLLSQEKKLHNDKKKMGQVKQELGDVAAEIQKAFIHFTVTQTAYGGMLWMEGDDGPETILKFHRKIAGPLLKKVTKHRASLLSPTNTAIAGNSQAEVPDFELCLDAAINHAHIYGQGHCFYALGRYEEALMHYMDYFNAMLTKDTLYGANVEEEEKEGENEDLKILAMDPHVLANTCACFMLTGQTQQGEDLFLKVNEIMYNYEQSHPHTMKPPHFLIMSLTMGTYYCTEGNFERGIQIINGILLLDTLEERTSLDIKSIKSNQDTSAFNHFSPKCWSYVRPCYLEFFNVLTHKFTFFKDSFIAECLKFLELVAAQAAHDLATLDRGKDAKMAGRDDVKSLQAMRHQAEQFKAFLLEASDML